MTTTTAWSLSADMQDNMTVEGQTFANVVTTVHWRVTATDADGATETRYGSVNVPSPTSADTYIDLSSLQELTEAERRATVLGWAEAIHPGFVDEHEAKVIAALEAKKTAPKIDSVSIL